MTVDVATPTQTHTIAGIGPYGTTWPYVANSLSVGIVQDDGTITFLTAPDFSVDPVETAVAGNVFLSPAIATANAARTLYIERATAEEQGWVGNLSAREKGLETQLDVIVMSAQERRGAVDRSLRATVPLAPFAPGAEGTTLIRTAAGYGPGPSTTDIADAQANAAIALTQAGIATAAAASINSRAVDNTAALKALDTTVWRAAIIRTGANAGWYTWQAGDYSVAHTAEGGADYYLIKADALATTVGCWVRNIVRHDPDDFHIFAARDGAVNFEVEALDGATTFWNVSGGTPPFGPTLHADGAATNVSGAITMKGEGGLTIGNAGGKLLDILYNLAGYVSDRILKIRPGVTGQSYASLDAEAGLDLMAGGDAVVRVLDGAGAGTALLNIEPQGTNFISVYTGFGKSLILSGDGLQLQQITQTDFKWTAYTVNSSGTVNLGLFVGVHLINPTADPIAALTINFPASPADGNVIRISARNAVTAVTWASLGGHSIVGAPAGLARDNPLSFIFFTGFGWQRIT